MLLGKMILFILISLLLAIGVFSLPVLLPPLRRWARSSLAARRRMTFASGGLTFLSTVVICVIVITYIGAITSAFYVDRSELERADDLTSDLFIEIWLREVIPPPLSLSCYTTETTCNLVDENDTKFGFLHYGVNLGIVFCIILFGLIIAAINIFLVRWFTRSPASPSPNQGNNNI